MSDGGRMEGGLAERIRESGDVLFELGGQSMRQLLVNQIAIMRELRKLAGDEEPLLGEVSQVNTVEGFGQCVALGLPMVVDQQWWADEQFDGLEGEAADQRRRLLEFVRDRVICKELKGKGGYHGRRIVMEAERLLKELASGDPDAG